MDTIRHRLEHDLHTAMNRLYHLRPKSDGGGALPAERTTVTEGMRAAEERT